MGRGAERGDKEGALADRGSPPPVSRWMAGSLSKARALKADKPSLPADYRHQLNLSAQAFDDVAHDGRELRVFAVLEPRDLGLGDAHRCGYLHL